MRNSLYDALEVSSSASVSAIATALRAVVRRFWSVPRDASGDSEEAVRFAALAASILVDPIRRKDYDAALNPGVGAGPWRLPIASAGARDPHAESASTHSRASASGNADLSQLSMEATPPKSLPGVDALAEPLADGRAWASPLVWVGLLLAAALLIFACARYLPDWIEFSTFEAGGVGLVLIALLLLIAFGLSKPVETKGPAAGLSRLGIIKWRREGSIFIGVPAPQHDTAWVFKLRLMELTRSSAGFITATQLWRRLLARVVDYAWIALAIYASIKLFDDVVDAVDPWMIVIRSPLLLPVLVALAAIPIEALALRVFRTTPGKWLLGLVLVVGVTRPADHDKPSQAQLSWARALRVAWAGAAVGLWPIAIIRSPKNWREARDRETDWEAAGDSVVMARPLTAQTVATALVIVSATALILTSGWRRDYAAIWPYVVIWSASAASHASPPRSSEKNDAVGTVATAIGTAPNTDVPAPVPMRNGSAGTAGTAGTAGSAGSPGTASIAPKSTPTSASATTGPSASTLADAEMTQQASAAQARRARIVAYTKQAESAQRSGLYADLQGSCQSWTVDQPGNALAWRCLGLAKFQNGAGRDALPALRQSLKLGSKDQQVEAAILTILRP